jgi:hypothetical protein
LYEEIKKRDGKEKRDGDGDGDGGSDDRMK